jgi:hypothetical protein
VAGREIIAINTAQGADRGVAVLAAIFAILVAMPSVEAGLALLCRHGRTLGSPSHVSGFTRVAEWTDDC